MLDNWRLRVVQCFLFSMAVAPVICYALPWDIDISRQPSYQTKEIARSPVKGSVPVGRMPFTLSVDEAEKQLHNPISRDLYSTWRGERLWRASCAVCHGDRADSQTYNGQLLAAPSLLQDIYRNRADGRYFAIITKGGVNMPRYGYKFNAEEKWDLINYLRYLQDENGVATQGH